MKNIKKGFTLLEILLVVGIIAILAGIVIVAINPARQLAQTRNAERRSDLKQLYSAMNQYYIDYGHYPATSTLDFTLKEVCDTGTLSSPSGLPCTGLIDLSELVPTYITAIPKDPTGPLASLPFIETAYAAAGGTGYTMAKDPSNKIFLVAPNTEVGAMIAIGTTTGTTTGGTSGPLGIGLVAHWKMNETGGITVVDTKGNNHGSSVRNAGILSSSGVVGTSLLNDNNAGDIITVPAAGSSLNSLLNGGNPFSISIWEYADWSGDNPIFNKGIGSLNDPYIGMNAYNNYGQGITFFELAAQSSPWYNEGIYIGFINPLGNTEWRNYVITYDGSGQASGVHLYVDSAEIIDIYSIYHDNFELIDAGAGPQADLLLGDPVIRGNHVVRYDDTRIYNRVLDQSEIDLLYNSGSGTEAE